MKLGLKTEHQPCCPLLRGLLYCDQNQLEVQLMVAFKRSKELFVSKQLDCLGSLYVCLQVEGGDGMHCCQNVALSPKMQRSETCPGVSS